MSPGDGEEPIEDGEFLYRKISVSSGYYDPQKSLLPSPHAYHPIEEDTTGISLDRAKYRKPEDAAVGRSKKGYYVAKLRAGDLRACGIQVVPKPIPGNSAHAEIPGLTYQNRKSNQAEEWKLWLAEKLTLEVLGPFTAKPHDETENSELIT